MRSCRYSNRVTILLLSNSYMFLTSPTPKDTIYLNKLTRLWTNLFSVVHLSDYLFAVNVVFFLNPLLVARPVLVDPQPACPIFFFVVTYLIS